jgi:hypothetical protein
MLADLSPWSLIIGLGIPLIIIAAIGFALVMVIRLGLGSRRHGNSAVHAELVRIDERLTSIEKVLRDIE